MSPKPDPYQQELFRLAQDLGEVEIRDMPEEEPAPTTEQAADWMAPPVEHAVAPEDLFQKAYDELTAILQHFQKTMGWPAWQEPWWKQREKVLKGYGMTVEGFYAQLQKRDMRKKT